MSRFVLIKAVLGPIMRLMFRPRVEGAEHIPGDGPVILAGNHLTFIDSMILPLVCDRQVFFIGKDEYVTGKSLKGRLMAWFFTGVGMIPVDRDGGRGGVAALMTGRRVLEEGKVFGIYPEGDALARRPAVPGTYGHRPSDPDDGRARRPLRDDRHGQAAAGRGGDAPARAGHRAVR
ncbi:1-acyl-sn-glycerol-3-phosphate acyltransferase [Streptomyces canus]